MEDLLTTQIYEYVNDVFGESFQFREYQFDNIYSIISSIINDKEHTMIVNAPTGSGKSLICIISAGVLSRYYNKSSYILCSELMLFDQYYHFIKSHRKLGFGMIKGQTGNYKCVVNQKDIIYGDCKIEHVPWKKLLNTSLALNEGYECVTRCPYVKARKHALSQNVVLMTYHLYLLSMGYINKKGENPYVFPKKDVIFCDECHNIPDIVQKQYSSSISIKALEKLTKLYQAIFGNEYDLFDTRVQESQFLKTYPTSDAFYGALKKCFMTLAKEKTPQSIVDILKNDFQGILIDFQDEVTDYENTLTENIKYGKDYDENDLKLINWFSSYMSSLKELLNIICKTGSDYLVSQPEYDEETKKLIGIKFNCVKEDFITYDKLLKNASYRVLCSATVGGEDVTPFVKNIGVSFDEVDKTYQYKSIASTFHFEKSPIYVVSKYKMSYSAKEKSLPYIKEMIYKLCEGKYKGQRGIIQTGSYAIATQIYNSAPLAIKNRMIVYNDSKEKGLSITTYKKHDDSILIGPSLNEGVDFPDDLCRFIIIAKVPYPSLADNLVKEKMKLFPEWYEYTTINQIIQGIGRGIRHKNDYCETFILDGCFTYLYHKNKTQFPKEIRNRIQFINI